MIDTVVFDMDGVLVDAREWHYEALNLALSHFGETISRSEHLGLYDGLPTKLKLEMLTKLARIPKRLHPIINRLKQKYTIEYVHKLCKPNYRTRGLIKTLKRQGFKVGCASNSIRPTINLMLEKSGILSDFDFICSADDVTLPKPSPEIYLLIMKMLGTAAQSCLIIEDNENGIKAAEDSGAHVLAIKKIEEVNVSNVLQAISRASA